MSSTETNRPVHRITMRRVTVSIWKHETAEDGVRFDTTLDQVYRDKTGAWAHTQSLSRDSLLEAAEALRMAAFWVNGQYEELRREKAASSNGPTPCEETATGGSDAQIPY